MDAYLHLSRRRENVFVTSFSSLGSMHDAQPILDGLHFIHLDEGHQLAQSHGNGDGLNIFFFEFAHFPARPLLLPPPPVLILPLVRCNLFISSYSLLFSLRSKC